MRLRTAQGAGRLSLPPPWPPRRSTRSTASRSRRPPPRRRGAASPSPTASASRPGSSTAASTPRWPNRCGRRLRGGDRARRRRPLQPDELPAPDHERHGARRRAPEAPGPLHLGVGVRRHGRRLAAVRARPHDRRPLLAQGVQRSRSRSHASALPSDGRAPVAAGRQRPAGGDLRAVRQRRALELREGEEAPAEDLEPVPDLGHVVGDALGLGEAGRPRRPRRSRHACQARKPIFDGRKP